jgi:hypothetical protein
MQKRINLLQLENFQLNEQMRLDAAIDKMLNCRLEEKEKRGNDGTREEAEKRLEEL